MTKLPENWDDHQQSLRASILQSRAWADVQSALDRPILYDSAEKWSWLGYVSKTKGFSYLMLPYGPTVNGDFEGAFSSVIRLAEQGGMDFVRIEPMGTIQKEQLIAVGAREVTSINPKHTHIIDIRASEDELRGAMGSSLRNIINSTERRGIEIRQSTYEDELKKLFEMLDETASRAKVRFHSSEYLKTVWDVMRSHDSTKLYMAYHDNQAVAGALFYDYNGVRYYAHAGAHQDLNRKVNASTSLLWQAIIDAKRSGMHSFDMWGVSPENEPNHKWAGISAFKRSFGGITVNYLGTYDIPLKQAKYQLYRSLRKLRGGSQ